MKCELTLNGFELCFENSQRLLEDACADNLSLPTVGALLEIGLEESAKAFLIFICLNRLEKLSKGSIFSSIPLIPMMEAKVNEYLKKVDCKKSIEESFRFHAIKTETIRFVMSFLSAIPPESPDVRDKAFDFIRENNPTITKEQFYELLGKFPEMERMPPFFSSKIKESGLYVNCSDNGFERPHIQKEVILYMANVLYGMIYALNKLSGSFTSLGNNFDSRKALMKLTDLKFRLDCK